MAPTGRILSIKLEVPSSNVKTMAHSLAAKGRSRVPGTGITLTPKKETNNKYRTGMDENANSILKIQDPDEREAEQERLKAMRERLQASSNITDLSATSPFWNYMLWTNLDQNHVVPYKLKDGENLFSFENPFGEINFRWLSVHPLVAPSYEAYIRGDNGPNVMFYVYDEEVENTRSYKRKQEINSAITKLNAATPTKRKKVARLLGLPVSDNSKEEFVYNLIDDTLKETEFKSGKHKGLNPVRLFNKFMDMQGAILDAKFVVQEAVDFNIYRKRDSGIYEGETKIADSEEKLISDLTDHNSQQILIALEEKIKGKKLVSA